MDKYYMLKTGNIITQNDLAVMYEAVYGVRKLPEDIQEIPKIFKGIMGIVKDPTPDKLIRLGKNNLAVKLYANTTECSISDARKEVKKIMAELPEKEEINLEDFIEEIEMETESDDNVPTYDLDTYDKVKNTYRHKGTLLDAHARIPDESDVNPINADTSDVKPEDFVICEASNDNDIILRDETKELFDETLYDEPKDKEDNDNEPETPIDFINVISQLCSDDDEEAFEDSMLDELHDKIVAANSDEGKENTEILKSMVEMDENGEQKRDLGFDENDKDDVDSKESIDVSFIPIKENDNIDLTELSDKIEDTVEMMILEEQNISYETPMGKEESEESAYNEDENYAESKDDDADEQENEDINDEDFEVSEDNEDIDGDKKKKKRGIFKKFVSFMLFGDSSDDGYDDIEDDIGGDLDW